MKCIDGATKNEEPLFNAYQQQGNEGFAPEIMWYDIAGTAASITSGDSVYGWIWWLGSKLPIGIHPLTTGNCHCMRRYCHWYSSTPQRVWVRQSFPDCYPRRWHWLLGDQWRRVNFNGYNLPESAIERVPSRTQTVLRGWTCPGSAF